MSNPLEFDFVFTDNPKKRNKGFDRWARTQQKLIKKISDEWGLPINKKVNVTFQEIFRPVEGVLRLDEFPEIVTRGKPLRLRIGKMKFTNHDIDSCVVLD